MHAATVHPASVRLAPRGAHRGRTTATLVLLLWLALTTGSPDWLGGSVSAARQPPSPDAVPLHDCLLLFRFGPDPTLMASLTGGEARDVNEAGQVVGWAATPAGSVRAVLWEPDGTARDLGTLGGDHSCALGVNASGQVVGWAQTATGEPHAFLWRDGAMADLGAAPGEQTVAYAISDAGVAVGLAWPVFPVPGGPMGRAVVWDDRRAIDLHAMLGTPCSGALGINASGAIVGWAVTDEAVGHAFLWADGEMTDLGAGLPGSSQAHAVNDAGLVVGWAETEAGARHAVRWEDGRLTALDPGSPWSAAHGLDGAGRAVGAATDADGTLRATRWESGTTTDLGTLGGRHGEAYAVNASGQVVGWAQDAAGEPHAFRWAAGEMVALTVDEVAPAR